MEGGGRRKEERKVGRNGCQPTGDQLSANTLIDMLMESYLLIIVYQVQSDILQFQ